MVSLTLQFWKFPLYNYGTINFTILEMEIMTDETSKYITRDIASKVIELSKWFPIVSVNGPRQSGKSTLLRNIFPDYEYINLEDVNIRSRALEDPVGFINNNSNKVIIDEAQYVPDIFSQLQVVSDNSREPGRFIISGSQNFLLLKSIKQSLAGRVGIVRLLPLSYKEIRRKFDSFTIEDMLFKGGYPGLYEMPIPEKLFFSNYVNTYALRDISELISPGNISLFKKFLRICALQCSNLVNLSKISRAVEISRETCMKWLNYLESSFICFELEPYYTNKIKSLTKTPKLYFYDTGLLVYMLGIKSKAELLNSEYLGAVVENFVISETVKNYWTELEEPELYFYRDDSKVEVDLLDFTDKTNITFSEIKSSHTYHAKYFNNLNKLAIKLSTNKFRSQVVMQTDASFNARSGRVLSIEDYFNSLISE